eukprot:s462_g42.t1
MGPRPPASSRSPRKATERLPCRVPKICRQICKVRHVQGSWVWSTHPFTLTLLDICGKSGILQAHLLQLLQSFECWRFQASP